MDHSSRLPDDPDPTDEALLRLVEALLQEQERRLRRLDRSLLEDQPDVFRQQREAESVGRRSAPVDRLERRPRLLLVSLALLAALALVLEDRSWRGRRSAPEVVEAREACCEPRSGGQAASPCSCRNGGCPGACSRRPVRRSARAPGRSPPGGRPGRDQPELPRQRLEPGQPCR